MTVGDDDPERTPLVPNIQPFVEPNDIALAAKFPVVRLSAVVEPSVVEPVEYKLVNEPVPPVNVAAEMFWPVKLVTVVDASVDEPEAVRLTVLVVLALVVEAYSVAAYAVVMFAVPIFDVVALLVVDHKVVK